MKYDISIDIPDHLVPLFNDKAKDLTDRGFFAGTAQFWAAIFIHTYGQRVAEVSEAVIEMFGTNLLHDMGNVYHFADKMFEYHRSTERVNQVLERMNNLLAGVKDEPLSKTAN